MEKYNPKEVEAKWRDIWAKNKTFSVDLKNSAKPYYNLMMFPYPSGEGLHVGHVYAFGGADTFGRFQKMQGQDVFEPMGFDAFGIHSENFAIKKNLHPKELIKQTTDYFRHEQLEKLGALFDWEHAVDTTDPNYYRWTQWLFLQLYRAKLAIKKEAPVPFCPSCKTVLADEQVAGGHCERCGSEVIQKVLSQWFFKITDYAQRLLDNLEKIDWSETTVEMQRNWIGRSEGAQIEFKIQNSKLKYRLLGRILCSVQLSWSWLRNTLSSLRS
jgi:leucyl-tRNA synthetase